MRVALVTYVCLLAGILNARLPDLIPFRKGTMWGFSDSTKKISIEPAWDEVGFFSGATAPVRTGKKWGVIDRSGKFVLSPDYVWIESEAHHGLRLIQQSDNGPMGALNDSGRMVVPLEFMWLSWQGPFLEGAPANCDNGAFDSTGRVAIPFVYRNCGDFPQSIGDSGLFAMAREVRRFPNKTTQYWGVVDAWGNTIIPFEYDWITASRCGNFEAFPFKGDPVYFDLKGNRIGAQEMCDPSPPWEGWFPLTNGMQAFQDVNGKWGYKDSTGNVTISPQFCSVQNFRADGLAEVWLRTTCDSCYGGGYIDIHGTEYWEN